MVDRPSARRRRSAAADAAALLRAAQELFAQRGFVQVTVRDIADRAGVNQALIFRHFGSKEGLFDAVLTGGMSGQHENTPGDQVFGQVLRKLLVPDASDASDAAEDRLYAILRSSSCTWAFAQMRTTLDTDYGQALVALTRCEDGGLRADLALAWLLGIGLLRNVIGKQPLAGADASLVSAYVLRAVATLLEEVDARVTSE